MRPDSAIETELNHEPKKSIIGYRQFSTYPKNVTKTYTRASRLFDRKRFVTLEQGLDGFELFGAWPHGLQLRKGDLVRHHFGSISPFKL